LYFSYTVVRNGVLWLTNMSLLTNIFIAHQSSAGEIEDPTVRMFFFQIILGVRINTILFIL